ncbi:phospholipase-like protein [Tanacetum coccineum]
MCTYRLCRLFWNIGIGIKLYEWAGNLVAPELVLDHHLLDRSELLKYITNLDIIGYSEDEERFGKLSDDNAIRLCLLLALELIFMGRLLTLKVDDTLFRLVENLEAWNSFPWGEHLWCHLYDEIKNLKQRHSDEHYYGLKKDHSYVPTCNIPKMDRSGIWVWGWAPPIKEQHSLFETCLAKLEKACKPGKTGFIVSSIGGTSDNSVKKKWLNDLVIMELNYRVFKLKTIIQDYLREEELRLCLKDEEMLRCEHEKLIVKDNRFRLDEAKRLRKFWLKLVFLDPARKGWLTEELLLQKGLPLFYANGERYTASWSEVFIPINETGEHWWLAEFHILSGDVTFYDTGYAYDCDYHDWYVKEMHEQILELQSLVGSNVAAKSVRLLKEFQYDDLESTRGMIRLICETQLKVQLLVVLERVNVFQKKGIDPSKYTITFRLVDNVPKQEGIYGDCGVWVCILLYRLAHGLSLDVDDLVDVAMTYREKMV